jgi:hypothetical protein
MMEVTREAAEDMPDQGLRAEDLPAPEGFLYLPEPFYIIDVNQKKCNVRAIRWGHTTPDIYEPERYGIMLSFYSAADDPEDYETALMQKLWGSGLILLHINPWPYGRTLAEIAKGLTARGGGGEAVASEMELLRFLVAFWTLCRGWADVEHHEAMERHLRKRLVKSGIWGDTPKVRVVTLRKRRPKHDADGGRDIEWSHRWIVRVRWRQQHYPSMGPAYIDGKWNPESHRLVYVMPFIKGPADKPLVTKKSVYRLVR